MKLYENNKKKLAKSDLIIGLEIAILNGDTDSNKKDMLIREKVNALKKIGWDPDQKIKVTKRGEYKVSSPFQKCLKNRNKVIEFAYDYFCVNEEENQKKAELEKKKNLTVRECFDAQMEKFENLAESEKRSKESSMVYKQSMRKYFCEYPNNIIEKHRKTGKKNFKPQMDSPLGDMPISKINAGYLHEYLEAITTDFDLTRTGLRDAKTALGKAFTYAVNNDIVTNNVLKSIDTGDIATKETHSKSQTVTAYPETDIVKLLDVMTDENVLSSYRKSSIVREAAAALCLETQMTIRSGETRNLKKSDIDFERQCLTIHSFVRRTRDENGKRIFVERNVTKAKSRAGDRTPCISSFGMEIINQSIARHPDSEYLFCTSKGMPLSENALAEWLKRFCKIAGVEYRRPHCLRATTITMLRDGGISKNRIQHSAGHLAPTTTDRYIDTSSADEITIEEADKIFSKPSKYQHPTKSYQLKA